MNQANKHAHVLHTLHRYATYTCALCCSHLGHHFFPIQVKPCDIIIRCTMGCIWLHGCRRLLHHQQHPLHRPQKHISGSNHQEPEIKAAARSCVSPDNQLAVQIAPTAQAQKHPQHDKTQAPQPLAVANKIGTQIAYTSDQSNTDTSYGLLCVSVIMWCTESMRESKHAYIYQGMRGYYLL
jgi:hypothetical protein